MFCSDVFVQRRPWWVTGLRVWVLAVLMLGMLVSSLGQVSSHGIAAVAAAQHDGEVGHGHSHEEDVSSAQPAGSDVVHVHHNSADHSHDKAHALPTRLTLAQTAAPVWWALAHPLAPGRMVFRLDRPPMA